VTEAVAVSEGKRIAEYNTILRSVVGSEVTGTSLSTGDRDEMGICIEPPEYVIGLKQFEQYVYRDKPDGVRSEKGDLDLTIYGLRKWTRLALKGNPTAIQLLFVPLSAFTHYASPGLRLRERADLFISKEAGKHFLGYMTAQRQRLLGERGQLRVNRPELVEEHGYDTKYAAHILRLGLQGVEYMQTGRFSLPMPEDQRDEVIAVRTGKTDLNTILSRTGELAREIEDLLTSSWLPDAPDYEAVDAFLVEEYRKWWDRPQVKESL